MTALYKSGYLIQSEFVEWEGDSDPDENTESEDENTVETGDIVTIKRPRFFTQREFARLQGFPDDFVIEPTNKQNVNRWYHQCGNAVSPPVV